MSRICILIYFNSALMQVYIYLEKNAGFEKFLIVFSLSLKYII